MKLRPVGHTHEVNSLPPGGVASCVLVIVLILQKENRRTNSGSVVYVLINADLDIC